MKAETLDPPLVRGIFIWPKATSYEPNTGSHLLCTLISNRDIKMILIVIAPKFNVSSETLFAAITNLHLSNSVKQNKVSRERETTTTCT